MKDVREKSMSGRGEESCDSDFISDVTGWSYDKDFDSDISGCVVDIVHALTGRCFHCNEGNPTKMCSKCKLARYCSKECEELSWKDDEEPHKEKCGKFSKFLGEAGGQIILGLYSHCFLEGTRALEMAMSHRMIPFLDEVARCSSASWRESTARNIINVEMSMVCAFNGEAFLVANAAFLDDKLQAWYDDECDKGICIAHMVKVGSR